MSEQDFKYDNTEPEDDYYDDGDNDIEDDIPEDINSFKDINEYY